MLQAENTQPVFIHNVLHIFIRPDQVCVSVPAGKITVAASYINICPVYHPYCTPPPHTHTHTPLPSCRHTLVVSRWLIIQEHVSDN